MMHALLDALDKPDVQATLGPEVLRDIAFLAIESAKYRNAHLAKCKNAIIREDRRTKIGLRWDIAARARGVAQLLTEREALAAAELRRFDEASRLSRARAV